MNSPPERRCNGCLGDSYHRVASGPEYLCDTCHPGRGPDYWTETHIATKPSNFEDIHKRWQRGRRASDLIRKPLK